MFSTSEIPYADTSRRIVTQAAAADDIVSTSAFGIAVALLIAGCDAVRAGGAGTALTPL